MAGQAGGGVAHTLTHIHINFCREAPTTPDGRLAGTGYEAVDAEVGSTDSSQGNSTANRALRRLAHTSLDEQEARELNAH